MNTYLAKLNEILSFINKMKQIYDLNTFSQQTQKHKQKVKKGFDDSSDLQHFYRTHYRTFVNFTELP